MKAEINFSFLKSEERGGESPKIISVPSFFMWKFLWNILFVLFVWIHKIIICLHFRLPFYVSAGYENNHSCLRWCGLCLAWNAEGTFLKRYIYQKWFGARTHALTRTHTRESPHFSSLHYPKWTVQQSLAFSAQHCKYSRRMRACAR